MGRNRLKFTCESAEPLVSFAYLWRETDKAVISDVDGTISKTDARGQFLHHFKVDWTHEGVVNLFDRVHSNGYRVIYLTARSLGMAKRTRKYLFEYISQYRESEEKREGTVF